MECKTDSDEELEGNNHAKQNEQSVTIAHPTSTGQFHFDSKEKLITGMKYIISRLKKCKTKYTKNPQYLFYLLNQLEKGVVNSAKQFIVHKRFQSNISVGHLSNVNNVRNMVTVDGNFL